MLRDQLAMALSSALGPLVDSLGCRAAIYRPTVTEALDGSPVRTYAIDAAWADVPIVFALGQPQTVADETDSIVKPFGVRASAKGTVTMLRTASGFPAIAAFDGLKMLDGPYAGYTWMAEADAVLDPIGASLSCRVIAAPAGVLP